MIARVVNIGQESTSTASQITQSIVVRHLQRPGAGRAALAFGLNGRFNDEDRVEEEDLMDRRLDKAMASDKTIIGFNSIESMCILLCPNKFPIVRWQIYCTLLFAFLKQIYIITLASPE